MMSPTPIQKSEEFNFIELNATIVVGFELLTMLAAATPKL
jgi:hypothetical protein